MANEKRTLEISARLNDFVTKNLSRVSRTIQRFGRTAGAAFKSLATRINPLAIGISGFVAAWAAFRGGKTVVEILESVDALDKLGDTLNTEVGRLTVLRGAFSIAGVEADKFTDILKTLGTVSGSVLDRNDQNLIQGLEQLGVTVDDLRSKDVVDLFEQIAGGLERYESSAERSAALARLFPENFQPMFAALARGQDEFRKLISLSELFVGTVSEDGAKAAGRFATAMSLLKTAIESVGRDALIQFAQRFAPTIERLATFIATNREAIARALAQIVVLFTKFVAFIGGAILKLAAFIAEKTDEIVESLGRIPLVGEAIESALREAFDVPELSDQAREIRDRANQVADEILAVEARIAQIGQSPAEFDPSGNRLAKYQDQLEGLRNELAGLNADFQSFAPGQNLKGSALDGASLRQMATLLKQLADFDNLPGLPVDFVDALNRLFGDGGVEKATNDIGAFFRGFGDQFDQITRKWSDFAQAGRDAATQLVDQGLSRLSDTLADIVTGTVQAKEAFKELARALLSDLARVLTRLLIIRAVSSIFGNGNVTAQETGGVVQGNMGRPVKLSSFEQGGIARGPTLALFGEGRASKGEAFVPLPDGRTIPVTLAGGSGGSHFTFNINAVDGQSVRRMLVENRETIEGVWMQAASGGNTKLRQVLQRAAN